MEINWSEDNSDIKHSSHSDIGGSFYVVTEKEAKELWGELENKLKQKRYFINPKGNIFKHYIDTLGEIKIIKDEGNFYRARKNERGKKFSKEQMGAPDWYLCKSGRLNPVGISYLYLSDSIETCCAECRPWIGAKITFAKFNIKRDLILKDLRVTKQEKNQKRSAKKAIKRSFSRPVTNEEGDLDYLITQCVTEYIKFHSKPKNNQFEAFDGIIYDSSVNKNGYNVLLFDPSDAEVDIDESLKNIEIEKVKIVPKIKNTASSWE